MYNYRFQINTPMQNWNYLKIMHIMQKINFYFSYTLIW